MFEEIFQSGKDLLLSQVVRFIIEPYVNAYGGTIKHFALDTSLKTITMDVLFEGEEALVSLVTKYETIVQDGKPFMRILGIESNRKWIGLMLSDLLKRGLIPDTHELPPLVSGAI
jgi:hypothetical protein